MSTNRTKQTIKADILIVGAGFAGSLATLCLHQAGFEVCLVEKGSHPRFAIGESSTPVADMILRDLSDRYSLSWLRDFSRYGSWQKNYPEITCGLKRGFSYYKHDKQYPFSTDEDHTRELLVAASSSNENSDTNWLRSELDAFLVEKVKEYGIPYFDDTDISRCEKDDSWSFHADRGGHHVVFAADLLVDATGTPSFLGNYMNIDSADDGFHTNSRALYTHFENVTPWSEILQQLDIPAIDYPYDPDHSALHHLIEEGWVWMLRFNNERTSMGIMLDQNRFGNNKTISAVDEWNSIIASYPSLRAVTAPAKLAAVPGRIFRTGRLQRCLAKAVGEGWVALPHTIGFVDPLHSTGIAHSLSGVERVVETIIRHWDDNPKLYAELTRYEEGIFRELELIDKLVAGCYRGLHAFELFNSWTMLYFTAAIRYEQQRLRGKVPSHFLSAGDRGIQQMVDDLFQVLQQLTDSENITAGDQHSFRALVKDYIAPYNTASLLDPGAKNMYHHTAAEL
ncbi:NAD(P)/FAD-dependent oxidoreductase [Halalkalibaculum sp. DA3122]|uniref:NAD(P)/FAD-dependent oxidoreductase n=1 Tax=Halalkalibaculum sp. DA3122 TaxID=3373607 RepID=UPI003754A36C